MHLHRLSAWAGFALKIGVTADCRNKQTLSEQKTFQNAKNMYQSHLRRRKITAGVSRRKCFTVILIHDDIYCYLFGAGFGKPVWHPKHDPFAMWIFSSRNEHWTRTKSELFELYCSWQGHDSQIKLDGKKTNLHENFFPAEFCIAALLD